MRYFSVLALLICGLFASLAPARAAVTINVDLSAQRMHVVTGSGETYDWPVSSGRSGFGTPHGYYRPTSLQTMHYSRKYDMTPMPHSIFFHGGYAIHGTSALAQLGRPASHGCVRLSGTNAALLFALVRQEGARISISGQPPGGNLIVKHHKRTKTMARAHRTHRHPHALAFAPLKRGPSLHQWMQDPLSSY